MGDYLLREVAGPLWRVKDLIVEDGEVEGKSQADGVSRSQVCESDVLRVGEQSVHP